MKNSILILIILLVIGVWSTVFTIDETEQVVILQFGQPVRIIKDPGLNFKLPAPIQVAQSFDNRLLEYDVPPEEILSKDKKSLIVDNYVRWKIIDPLLFLQTVQTEPIAKTRIDDIVYSMFLLFKNFRNKSDFCDILNIGGSDSIRLMDFVNTLENILNKDAIIEKIPKQLGDVENTSSDCSKLYKLINFSPNVNLKLH